MTELFILWGVLAVVFIAWFCWIQHKHIVEIAKIDAAHGGWKKGFADAEAIYKPALTRAWTIAATRDGPVVNQDERRSH